MKTFYNVACSEWMLMHPGQPITIYDIAELIGKAFPKAFSQSNILKGFEVSGLYPFNEHVFEENEFLTSYVTDRPMENVKGTDINKSQPKDVNTSDNHPAFPSTSSSTINSGNDISESSAVTGVASYISTTPVTPEMLRPFPKAMPRKNLTRGKAKGQSRILTDTPEKDAIASLKKSKGVKSPTIKNIKKQVFKSSKQTVSKKALLSFKPKMKKGFLSIESKNKEISISSGSDEFESWQEQIEMEHEQIIIEQKFEDANVRVGDFVLVKVPEKKNYPLLRC